MASTNLYFLVTQIAVLARLSFLITTLSWQTGALGILDGVFHAVCMAFPHLLAVPEKSGHPAWPFSSQREHFVAVMNGISLVPLLTC